MGNMNSLNKEDFNTSCIKPGYKIIGWDQAKIIDQKNNVYLTAPWKGKHVNMRCNDQPNYLKADGEYMVWENDTLLGEFLKKEHAIQFFNYLIRRK